MDDPVRNKWRRVGNSVAGFENLPVDGTEFLMMHPNWICPGVVAHDSATGKFIFVDPELFDINEEPEYIVDFTDMWFYVYDEFPEEFSDG
ncbi:MAG: hypothetical protein KJP02_06715 [Octadecabacter sp.]|nr:hypothetical protein [Octadecabacter sp.]